MMAQLGPKLRMSPRGPCPLGSGRRRGIQEDVDHTNIMLCQSGQHGGLSVREVGCVLSRLQHLTIVPAVGDNAHCATVQPGGSGALRVTPLSSRSLVADVGAWRSIVETSLTGELLEEHQTRLTRIKYSNADSQDWPGKLASNASQHTMQPIHRKPREGTRKTSEELLRTIRYRSRTFQSNGVYYLVRRTVAAFTNPVVKSARRFNIKRKGHSTRIYDHLHARHHQS